MKKLKTKKKKKQNKTWELPRVVFKILCQTGKIKNTKGHRDEDKNRCKAICS